MVFTFNNLNMNIKNWHVTLICSGLLAVFPLRILFLTLVPEMGKSHADPMYNFFWLVLVVVSIPSGLVLKSTELLRKNKRGGAFLSIAIGYVVLMFVVAVAKMEGLSFISGENFLFAILPSVLLIIVGVLCLKRDK